MWFLITLQSAAESEQGWIIAVALGLWMLMAIACGSLVFFCNAEVESNG